jgi:hypothetical protein
VITGDYRRVSVVYYICTDVLDIVNQIKLTKSPEYSCYSSDMLRPLQSQYQWAQLWIEFFHFLTTVNKPTIHLTETEAYNTLQLWKWYRSFTNELLKTLHVNLTLIKRYLTKQKVCVVLVLVLAVFIRFQIDSGVDLFTLICV